jgi:hypothetical protein
MTPTRLRLDVLAGTYAVCRLAGDRPIPPWATAGAFASITRAADELSIVCLQELVPEGVRCERGWRCLRVAGPLDFVLVGILASLAATLAAARISLFAVSTFDTDYLLVRADDLDGACSALRSRGHSVEPESDPGSRARADVPPPSAPATP